MKGQRFATAALLVLLTLGLGCATGLRSSSSSGAGASDAAADDMAELKARVVELQRRAVMSEVEMDRLREQVRALEALVGGQPGAVARRPTGTRPTPTEARPEARPEPQLNDRIADSRSARGSNDVEEENLAEEDLPVIEIADRTDPPRPPLPSTSERAPQASAPPPLSQPAPQQPATTPSATAQDLYDEGYAQYHQGNYIDAESRFRRFLQESGDTNLADNAQYWIGEARLARGDTRSALAAFRETVERYPDGNKVPDALLKAGQCLEKLGDTDGARASYREIVRRYPNSAASAVAEERSAKLP